MWRKMSLRIKFFILFLFIGLVPALIFGLNGYYSAQENIRDEVYDSMNLYGETIREEIHSFMANLEEQVRVLTRSPVVYENLQIWEEDGMTLDSPEWQERVEDMDALLKEADDRFGYDHISITDSEGTIIYSTEELPVGADLSDRDYWQETMRGNLAWEDLFYSDIVEDNTMTLTYPIYTGENQGEVSGVFVIIFYGSDIDAIVHNHLDMLGETADAYLIYEDGLLMTNTARGEYQTDAALDGIIDTEAREDLAPAMQREDLGFRKISEYDSYTGVPVIGDLSVLEIGDALLGLVVEVEQEEVFAGLTGLRNQFVWMGIVIALIVIGISYFTGHYLTGPIKKIVEMMAKGEKGDLTVSVDLKNEDELGLLARSFNSLTNSLREIIFRVQDTSNEVFEASENISAGTEQLSSGAETQAGSVEELTASMEEMGSSIQEVSENIQETSDHADSVSQSIIELEKSVREVSENIEQVSGEINQINAAMKEMDAGIDQSAQETRQGEEGAKQTLEIAREGQEQVEKTVQMMEKINSSVQKQAEGAEKLGSSAEQIGEIINLIDDIAEQTNLLALNASIEAARAGEHGRGFAVVAGAIGDLASKSQEATEDIASLIKSIQEEVKEAVEYSKEGSDRASEGLELSKTTGETFDRIRDAVGTIAEKAGSVADEIEGQNEEATRVSEATEKARELMSNISAATQEQSASTEEIVEMVEKMAELARDVAAASEEQSASTDEVIKSAENVSEVATETASSSEEISASSQSLKEQAQKLLETVKQFTIE